MPRKIFKKVIPTSKSLKERGALTSMGERIHDSNLWHLNKHSVSEAVLIGVFCAFLPMPNQMILAAFLAILLRANLPLSVALVWISNPITIPVIFFATYKLGAWLLDIPASNEAFQFTLEWFRSTFVHIWKPLLLGSIITGTITSTSCYLLVRYFWRWQVIRNWDVRKERRKGSGLVVV